MGHCSKCKETWTGMATCHCMGCHRTFGSIGAFDKHRIGCKCADPESIGMKMDGKWVWRVPMDEKMKKWVESMGKHTSSARKEGQNSSLLV